MKPIICFVFILFGYILISEVFSAVDCPGAKYPMENVEGIALFSCNGYSENLCLFVVSDSEELVLLRFVFVAPEDVEDIYYNVSISGAKSDARASGKVEDMSTGTKRVNRIPKNSRAHFNVHDYLDGDLSAGENATVIAKVYFNEKTKDIPDMCFTTIITTIENKVYLEEDD